MLKQAVLSLATRREVSDAVRGYPPFHGLAKRFVAGETADDAVRVAKELNARGLHVSLDHLGEDVLDRAESDRATNDYLSIIDRIAVEDLDATVSIKLTQIGLDLDPSLCLDALTRVVEHAAQHDIFVRIDMEGSIHTARTLETFWRVWRDHKNVGPVIQAYLYRSVADVTALNEAKARVRLCKGAYNEPPTVAFPEKWRVDLNYIRLAEALLLNGTYPALATHDEEIIGQLQNFAQSHGIDQSRFEFQMLYGIRRDLQERLADGGYNVRVYVPFGTQWYPYLMRRMAERPANLLFVLKNAFR